MSMSNRIRYILAAGVVAAAAAFFGASGVPPGEEVAAAGPPQECAATLEHAELPGLTLKYPAPSGPSSTAVVLIHGWIDSPDGWVAEMAKAIANDGRGVEADVYIVDYRNVASVFGSGAPPNPGPAKAVGDCVGAELRQRTYANVHFIAHSLGAWVADSASRKLSGVNARITFLDPYVGFLGDRNWATKELGGGASSSEAFIDYSSLSGCSAIGGLVGDTLTAFGKSTDILPQRSTEIDITKLKTKYSFAGCAHNWPIDYYMRTIKNPDGFANGYKTAPEANGSPPKPAPTAAGIPKPPAATTVPASTCAPFIASPTGSWAPLTGLTAKPGGDSSCQAVQFEVRGGPYTSAPTPWLARGSSFTWPAGLWSGGEIVVRGLRSDGTITAPSAPLYVGSPPPGAPAVPNPFTAETARLCTDKSRSDCRIFAAGSYPGLGDWNDKTSTLDLGANVTVFVCADANFDYNGVCSSLTQSIDDLSTWPIGAKRISSLIVSPKSTGACLPGPNEVVVRAGGICVNMNRSWSNPAEMSPVQNDQATEWCSGSAVDGYAYANSGWTVPAVLIPAGTCLSLVDSVLGSGTPLSSGKVVLKGAGAPLLCTGLPGAMELFEGGAWSGPCVRLGVGSMASLMFTDIRNLASSIRLNGTCLVITLFEFEDFSGRSMVLTSDVEDFGSTALGHDASRSVRVDPCPASTPPLAAPSVPTKAPTTPPNPNTPPAPSKTPAPGATELLVAPWHLQSSGGETERSQPISRTALRGKTRMIIEYNLNGLVAGPEDDSGIIVDQYRDWNWVALSSYGKNGAVGVQIIDVSLGDFGLNPEDNIDGVLRVRFWAAGGYAVDILRVAVY